MEDGELTGLVRTQHQLRRGGGHHTRCHAQRATALGRISSKLAAATVQLGQLHSWATEAVKASAASHPRQSSRKGSGWSARSRAWSRGRRGRYQASTIMLCCGVALQDTGDIFPESARFSPNQYEKGGSP